MTNILNSLMCGGWEPENDLNMSTDFEIAMEEYEKEHPEIFQTFREDMFKAPFTVWTMDRYDPEPDEREITDLWTAISKAEGCIEDGGDANVTDADGADVPLFARWYKSACSAIDDKPVETDELPF